MDEKKEVVYELGSRRESKKEEIWKSCCFELNPHGVAYAGQFIFSMSVLTFSAIMLVRADGSCDKSSPYIGLISFLLGKLLNSVMASS